MQGRTFYYLIVYTFILLLISIMSGCKKDPADHPVGSNAYVNTWILDSLRRYYFWNESLPKKPDLNQHPTVFFKSLLNAADRFSYMVDPQDPASYPPSNRNKFGFDYATVRTDDSNLIFGIIKYVYNDSPASRSGLKRGDYISRINGERLTTSNAGRLQNELSTSGEGRLTIATWEGDALKDLRTVDLIAGVILEQSVKQHIFQLDTKKIGYLYLNDFSPGLAQSVIPNFNLFKNETIDALIIDIRYNPGGQVAEAAGVAALISGLAYNTPFITYTGNKNGGRKTESIGHSASSDHSMQYSQLLEASLGLRQLYLLVTGTTASAAELLINDLRPYVNVITIGETTRGKDQASFVIKDMRQTKTISWELHPIIYKLSNARGEGDYSTGIVPQYHVNELEYLPLKELGAADDPLVQRVFTLIQDGISTRMRKDDPKIAIDDIHVLTDSRQMQTAYDLLQTRN